LGQGVWEASYFIKHYLAEIWLSFKASARVANFGGSNLLKDAFFNSQNGGKRAENYADLNRLRPGRKNGTFSGSNLPYS
jgi:hypothetical protein